MSTLLLVLLVLTYVVEASLSQLLGPHRNTRRPVDEGEQPLLALLHGRVGHVGESGSPGRHLGRYS